MKAKELIKLSKSKRKDDDSNILSKKGKTPLTPTFPDNRQEAVYQTKLQKLAEDSPLAKQALAVQDQVSSSPITLIQTLRKEEFFGAKTGSEATPDLEAEAPENLEVQLIEQINQEREKYKIFQLAEELEHLQNTQTLLNTTLGPHGKSDKLMSSGLGQIIPGLVQMDTLGEITLDNNMNLSEKITAGHKQLSSISGKFKACALILKNVNASFEVEEDIYDSMPNDLERAISTSGKALSLLTALKFQDSNAQRRLKILITEIINFSLWLQAVKADVTGEKTGKTVPRKLSAKNSKR